MGQIPVSLDRQPQPVPATQQGVGDYNMRAIGIQESANQDVLKGVQSGVNLIGQVVQKKMNATDEADMAKYEHMREEYDAQRRLAIGNTKDVEKIKAANKAYYDNVNKLVSSNIKDSDSMPIFRSSRAQQAAKNDWLRRQGNEKFQHIEYLRTLNDKANTKRFNDLNTALIRNTDNTIDEKINENKIRTNLNLMFDEGLINFEEYDARIESDIMALRKSSNYNQLAKLDNNIKGVDTFKAAINDYKEELKKRKDMSPLEMKEYIDAADKLVKQKETNWAADINMEKFKRVNRHKTNSDALIMNMNDDGSLNISNDELKKMMVKDDISTEFGTAIIEARAKNDQATAKAKAKLVDLRAFENVWDEINTYDPSKDPNKVKLADLYTKIIPFPTGYDTALTGALKTRISEFEKGMTEKEAGSISANSNVLKETEGMLKALLGVGTSTIGGNTILKTPLISYEIDVPPDVENKAMYKYTKRLEIYNALMSDFRNKAKTMDANELQDYIFNKNPRYKALVSENAAKNFFRGYDQSRVMENYNRKIDEDQTGDEWIRVQNSKGETRIIRKRNLK